MGRRPTLGPLYGLPDGPMLPRYPQVLVRPRMGGKSTHALSWVQRGERVKGYPGWSRVLVVPNVNLDVTMRGWQATPEAIAYAKRNHDPMLLTEPHPSFDSWWSCIPDWSHRVFDYRSWANARGAVQTTEVRVDEINMLWDFLQLPGTVTGFTMTAEEWQPEDD